MDILISNFKWNTSNVSASQYSCEIQVTWFYDSATVDYFRNSKERKLLITKLTLLLFLSSTIYKLSRKAIWETDIARKDKIAKSTFVIYFYIVLI